MHIQYICTYRQIQADIFPHLSYNSCIHTYIHTYIHKNRHFPQLSQVGECSAVSRVTVQTSPSSTAGKLVCLRICLNMHASIQSAGSLYERVPQPVSLCVPACMCQHACVSAYHSAVGRVTVQTSPSPTAGKLVCLRICLNMHSSIQSAGSLYKRALHLQPVSLCVCVYA